MRKMSNINLIKSSIRSSQGNLDETIQAIKSSKITISSKEIPSLEEMINVPYFLFEEKVQENKEDIFEAMKCIVSDVISELNELDRRETALIIGTSQVDLNTRDSIKRTIYEKELYPSLCIKRSIDSYAKDISNEFGLNDYTMTIATACTSSANAVLEASKLINAGIFKYVVIVGVEVFSTVMSSGFSSMKLLSCNSQKPFDNSRNGLVLGEAIASILLGKDDSLWSLEGGFSNCDSATITSVSASGDEFAKVMKNCLKIAGVKPQDITALKTHATSTYTNDIAEVNAIRQVFDENIIFTAFKPYVGHTLGACGVLELAILMGSVDDGFIPKTINHVDSIYKSYVPLLEHKECSSGTFMLNYFGFGGNNTSLIIKKEES